LYTTSKAAMLIVFAVLEALALRVRSIMRLMKPAKHMTRKHIIRIPRK